jgi:hypothetical protein
MAEALGSATLSGDSSSIVDLAAAGAAVASGSAEITLTVSMSASGSAVAGGQAEQQIHIQLSAQALAEASGSGQLQLEVPLSAFGAAVAGGAAMLYLVENDTEVRSAPRRIYTSGLSRARRPVVQASGRSPVINTRTRH